MGNQQSQNMNHLVFLVILILGFRESENVRITSQCGQRGPHNDGFRIVNGTLASKGEFPWLVSIRVRDKVKHNNKHNCGGAIISSLWILTAAHCVYGKKSDSLLVVAGENNINVEESSDQSRNVTSVYIRNFDLATFANDIALLKLESQLENSHGINFIPICLPGSNQEFLGQAIVAGWGTTENGHPSDLLHFIEISLIEKSVCNYNYIRHGHSRLLNSCQICAGLPGGGKDACQGDSGGPLVCEHDGKYVLCGIVSWGIGCGNKNFPGIYTKVACYMDWIQNIISIH